MLATEMLGFKSTDLALSLGQAIFSRVRVDTSIISKIFILFSEGKGNFLFLFRGRVIFEEFCIRPFQYRVASAYNRPSFLYHIIM